MHSHILNCLVVVLATGILCVSPSGAGEAPTTRPAAAGSDHSISAMHRQTVSGFNYIYISSDATLAHLIETIDKLAPKLDAAASAGKILPAGPMVFTYHGVTGEPDDVFTLDVGIIAAADSPVPDGFKSQKTEPLTCATILYTGSSVHLKDAYMQLYNQIDAAHLHATDLCREVYLFWESRESANNVVQIQAGIAPR